MYPNLKSKLYMAALILLIGALSWSFTMMQQGKSSPCDDLLIITNRIEPANNPPCNCSRSGDPIASHNHSSCDPNSAIPCLRQDAGYVYLHNGEAVYSATDLEIPGRGLNWRFARKYRSGILYDGPLGHNWEFNYNRRLVLVTDQNLAKVKKTFGTAQKAMLFAWMGWAASTYTTTMMMVPINRWWGFIRSFPKKLAIVLWNVIAMVTKSLIILLHLIASFA